MKISFELEKIPGKRIQFDKQAVKKFDSRFALDLSLQSYKHAVHGY